MECLLYYSFAAKWLVISYYSLQVQFNMISNEGSRCFFSLEPNTHWLFVKLQPFIPILWLWEGWCPQIVPTDFHKLCLRLFDQTAEIQTCDWSDSFSDCDEAIAALKQKIKWTRLHCTHSVCVTRSLKKIPCRHFKYSTTSCDLRENLFWGWEGRAVLPPSC